MIGLKSAGREKVNIVKKAPTILDIAKLAGVTHGTVSRVLNDKPINCREAVRKKILRIAEDLNYRPNLAAQTLKTQHHNAIGIMAYDITDAFEVDCIGALETSLVNTRYRAYWLSAGLHAARGNEDLLEKLRKLPIDGLIVLATESLVSDGELLALHAQDHIRITTMIRKIDGGHLSSVTLDNAMGIQLLVEHLIALGHQKLGFCHDTRNHQGAVIRFKTFLDL
ncbi:MAG: LacI family DNA-binding transcriptional regulator [Patescibacteria group bacterium]